VTTSAVTKDSTAFRSTHGAKLLFLAIAVASANVIVSSIYAHGPTPRTIDEKVEIVAKPKVVWALISDFVKMQNWHPFVVGSKAQSDKVQGNLRI
jgi:hypothetical protein